MNSEKLNRWLSLGANIGVIAGIAFLAFELRQNNDLLESESQYRLFENRRHFSLTVSTDPVLADLFLKLQSGDPLTANEQLRARALFRATYQNWYWEYNEWTQGRIEDLPLRGWVNLATSSDFALSVIQGQIQTRKDYGGVETRFAQFLEELMPRE